MVLTNFLFFSFTSGYKANPDTTLRTHNGGALIEIGFNELVNG